MIGFEFESKIEELLESYACQKNYMLFSEKYIQKITKGKINKIDHCLLFPSSSFSSSFSQSEKEKSEKEKSEKEKSEKEKKEKIICIQDKYKKQAENKYEIKNIYEDSQALAEILGADLLFVILISRVPHSKNAPKYNNFINFTEQNGNVILQLENWLKNLDSIYANPLYKHQQKAIDKFECRGRYIIKHPVGSGKTITMLGCIDKFIKKYKNGRILWITKRLDILESQFNNHLEFRFFPWLFSKVNICPSAFENRGQIIITNIDQILNKNLPIFDLIIIDEAHNAGAEKCFQFLANQNTNLLGFSATPFRNNIEQIFIDGILDELSFYEAVKSNIIIAPKIHYVAVNSKNGIFEERLKIMYPEAVKLFNLSKTGYCIAWSSSIEKAEKWYEIFCEDFDVYKNYGSYCSFSSSFSSSFSQSEKEKSEKEKSEKEKKIKILLCVGRCKEGFNVPIFDVAVSLDNLKSGKNTMIQKLGRVARKYEGKTECHYLQGFEYKNKETIMEILASNLAGIYEFVDSNNAEDSILISNGEIKIGNIMVGMQGYLENIDWSELEKIMKAKLEITYFQLKKIIKSYGIKTYEEYNKCKDLRFVKYPENLPNWEGWDKFLGVEFYSFAEMKKIISEFHNLKGSMTEKYELIKSKKNDIKIPCLRIALEFYKNLKSLFNEECI